MDQTARRAAVARAATRIAQLNLARDDDFQDTAIGEVLQAQDAFRGPPEAELPPPGADPLLDALMELARALDESPEAVSEACDRVRERAGILGEWPVSSPSWR